MRRIWMKKKKIKWIQINKYYLILFKIMDYIKNNILNKDNKQFYNNLFNQLYLAIYNNNIDLLIQLINELL